MHPELFEIFGITIRTYSVMLLVAFVVAIFVLRALVKRRTVMNPDVVIDLAFWVIIGVVVGARLLYVIMHWKVEFASNPITALYIWQGGAVYYGGFILAFAAGIIFMKVKKLPVLPLLDVLAPVVALGEGIGRIGCFFNGCCYGQPSNVCAISYPADAPLYREMAYHIQKAANEGVELYGGSISAGDPLLPTPLFQSGGGIGLFIILMLLLIFIRMRKGQLFGMFLFGFGGLRFAVNFFRHYYPPSDFWTNQIIALVLVACGIALFIFSALTQEKTMTPEEVASERAKMAAAAAKKEEKKKKKRSVRR